MCVLQHICSGCKIIWLRYTVLGFTVIVSLFFGVPASLLFFIHVNNYLNGQTTNERFANKVKVDDDDDSDDDTILSAGSDDNLVRRKKSRVHKKGCWLNCK